MILSTAHAQKRPEYYFRFQNGPRIRNRHGRKPMCLEFYPKAAFLRVFWRYCHCACAETPRILLLVSKWTSDSEPACLKNYTLRNLEPKLRPKDVSVRFSLRMRRNAQNTTSGFKMDFGFGTGMPKKLYV